MRYVLGISGLYHDSAAALLGDGRILAAVQEERLSRRKNDARFPERSIRSCLDQAGITARDLEAVAFYEKPILKFSRTLEVFLGWAPRGGRALPGPFRIGWADAWTFVDASDPRCPGCGLSARSSSPPIMRRMRPVRSLRRPFLRRPS